MRDLFYVELGKRLEEIREIESTATPEETAARNNDILGTVAEIIRLSNIGRREGLLALEEAAFEMEDENRNYVKRMILLVVDGTVPELIEEICTMRYMANGYKAYEGLEYMMYLLGILSIQEGLNPRIIEEKLMSMVPEAVYSMFCERREQELNNWVTSSNNENIDMTKVKRLYEGTLAVEASDEAYLDIKLLDYVFTHMHNRMIQRLLREVDNADLELAMKGLSGAARKRIFDNMSKRLCVMVAEDIEYMGRVRLSTIRAAAHKIFHILMKLMDCGEIVCGDGEPIYLIHEFWLNDDGDTFSFDEILRHVETCK